MHGPHVVLMGNGRSENEHNPVPQYLIHRPFKAVDGLHHDVNRRVEALVSLLRAEIPDQVGGVFDVSEQDNLLAFDLRIAAGGQNFLGSAQVICMAAAPACALVSKVPSISNRTSFIDLTPGVGS